ncbi:DUF6049 family protein [Nocardioides mesophilus]|uniref:Secreted protein n=1 Tax=Nocardioides mesophilus TaxID=433659 RepID=A0A7G9RFQ5_9ACTN|nr:DUF6049 family protein [Nocardioides mesophilus]QNN54430.1 hypothetical protein H9L09_08970 [Nocardioides mesophilus]
MTRPVLSRAAACLAAVLVTGLAGGLTAASPATASPHAGVAAVAAVAPGESTPLHVTMDTLTPSVIPRRGQIIVSGEVTNRSDSTWTDLQVYLFTSADPIGDSADLAAAAESDPAAEVGARLYQDGLFTEIGDLAPGESTQYVVSVGRSDLEISGAPGVYWIGVHVLGAEGGPRDLVADGRARAFIPLVDPGTPRTRLAVTVPLREQVLRGPEQRLLGIRRWERLLDTDGRLDRLLAFGASSSRPVTWLVDPAVLDAAASVAAGNPPLDTSDDGSGPESEKPSPSPAQSGSADPSGASGSPDSVAPAPSGGSDGSGDPGGSDAADSPTLPQQAAAAWLEAFRAATGRGTVMSLPYADIDVGAVTTAKQTRILREAQRLSESAAARLGYVSRPVIAPPAGYLPAKTLARLDDTAPVLLRDEALPGVDGATATRSNGVEVVLADTAAAAGGPGPNDPGDPLAMRQRILAEAALHALGPRAADPLVVSLPAQWDPGPGWQRADFFGGLDVPWLTQVGLPAVLARSSGPVDTSTPVYPLRQRRAQVPFANQLATEELVRVGSTYAQLLTRNDSVRDQLARAAMPTSSYHARTRPGRALTLARQATEHVRETLDEVVLEGPAFVMMSSDTGPVGVTVANNLDQTVTVQLVAQTGTDALTISSPDPITLGPGQRSPVRMRAHSTSVGLQSVTLQATTVEGTPLGSSVRFNVRTSNVGLVIWLVMGAGALLFFAAIGVRIARRVRTRRATHGPLLERQA